MSLVKVVVEPGKYILLEEDAVRRLRALGVIS